jgi:tRNA U38,U39,U40 pseudouridine synthase TruA
VYLESLVYRSGIIFSNSSSRFNARENSEARTWEYLIPSYAFYEPPKVSSYRFSAEMKLDLENIYIDHQQVGGIYNVQRNPSLMRRKTFMRPLKVY